MHKFLTAAAVLGLLTVTIPASAQTTNQATTKNEAAANKAANADTQRKGAKKGVMKRETRVTQNKRLAMHKHKMRSAKAMHGKRFVKSHGRHRHVYGFSAGKRIHRGHHHHRVAYRGGCR